MRLETWSRPRGLPVAAVLTVTTAFAAGCGSSTEPAGPVASVTVAPTDTSIAAADTVRLAATPRDAGGQALRDRRIAWSSSAAGVARVDSTGLVAALAAGVAGITATVDGISGTATVTVTPAAVASVSVTPDSTAVEVGRSVQLIATPRDALDQPLPARPVTWGSSDPGIADVDAGGLVRGVSPGVVTVSAISEGVVGEARVTVRPRPVAAVSVVPDKAGLIEGTTVQFDVVLLDAGGDTITDARSVAWSASDSSVVNVSGTGAVTGGSPGTAVVRATVEGVSGQADVTVVPPVTFAMVEGGVSHTCGITPAGVAYCWGQGDDGQLGNGARLTQNFPVQVVGGLSFDDIGAGGQHSCARTPAGAGYCWGDNASGELGDGAGDAFVGHPEPVAVSGGLTFDLIVVGTAHSCGIASGGTAYCWGDNFSAQLGDGTTTSRDVPTAVSGAITFSQISAGGLHTCGLTPAGAAYCWGSNGHGQLGDGTTESHATPVAVAGGLVFTAITAGPAHTCAIDPSDLLYCWGRNDHGQLGDGTTTSRSTPTPVAGGLSFQSVALGYAHTCAITTTGIGYCWGWGDRGQLGVGDTNDRYKPNQIAGNLDLASVAAGSFHSCAVTTAGIAYCWGGNSTGQLGDGTVSNRVVPTKVTGQP